VWKHGALVELDTTSLEVLQLPCAADLPHMVISSHGSRNEINFYLWRREEVKGEYFLQEIRFSCA